MNVIKNILWVCFGNSARSPLAHGLSLWLKDSKEYKEALKDVNFDSAGFVNVFKRAQDETLAYLREKGIDFSEFKGKIMDEALLKKQDLILVMETRHIKRLKRKFKQLPEVHQKARLLLEFAGESEQLEIEDPVNKTKEEYATIANTIEEAVKKAIEKIIKMNKNILTTSE